MLAKEWWKSRSIKFNCCFFKCLFASLQVWFYCVPSWVHTGLLNHLTSCLLTCFHPEVEWACHAGVVNCCWEFNWDTDLYCEYQNCPSVSFPHIHLAFNAGWGKQLLSCRAALSFRFSFLKWTLNILCYFRNCLGLRSFKEMLRKKHSRNWGLTQRQSEEMLGEEFCFPLQFISVYRCVFPLHTEWEI